MKGPPNRNGFTPFANSELERFFMLTPEQGQLYIGLRCEAQYSEPKECRDKFGRAFILDVGETLFGIDSCAARYGLSIDQVRRAVRQYEQLGLMERHLAVAVPATHRTGRAPTSAELRITLLAAAARRVAEATAPATPPATPPTSEAATPHGREAATPPTVLRFLTDREICWGAKEAATPPQSQPATHPATPPAASPATIQHRTQNTQHEEEAKTKTGPRASLCYALGPELLSLKLSLEQKLDRGLTFPSVESFDKVAFDYLSNLVADYGVEAVAVKAAEIADERAFALAWFASAADQIKARLIRTYGHGNGVSQPEDDDDDVPEEHDKWGSGECVDCHANKVLPHKFVRVRRQ